MAGSIAISIYGSLSITANTIWTNAAPTSFLATNSQTIQTNGVTLSGGITLNGFGLVLTMLSAVTIDIAKTLTLSQGSLVLNGFTFTTGFFTSTVAGTRNISFGSSNIVLAAAASTTIANCTSGTTFTTSGTGGFVRNDVNGGTVTWTSGSDVAAANFSFGSSTPSFNITTGSQFKNLDFTGWAGTINASTIYVAGALTLSSTGTFTNATFVADGTASTITTNGKSFAALTVAQSVTSGVSLTLQDNVTVAGAVTVTTGTLNTNNFNVNATALSSSGTGVRTINMGSGTWTLSASSPVVFTTKTNLTFNCNTSTIQITSASAVLFAGNGLTFYKVSKLTAGSLTLSAGLTFNTIEASAATTGTLIFPASSTTTLSNLSFNGVSTAVRAVITSSTAGTQATLASPSSAITLNFANIKDSNASGPTVWTANNSLNSGNNTGWNFGGAPSGNMLLMFF
jgi:hypothetical protein